MTGFLAPFYDQITNPLPIGGGGGGTVPTEDHIFQSVAARDAYFTTRLDELITGTPIFVADTGLTYLEVWGGATNPPSYDNSEWVRGGAIALTAEQIKTLYESNADTNAYTDNAISELENLRTLSITYGFDTGTSVNPPARTMRLNTPLKGTTNTLYLDGETLLGSGGARFDELFISFSGFIIINSQDDSSKIVMYQTSGAVSFNSTDGFFTVPVNSRRLRGGEFTAGEMLRLTFVPSEVGTLSRDTIIFGGGTAPFVQTTSTSFVQVGSYYLDNFNYEWTNTLISLFSSSSAVTSADVLLIQAQATPNAVFNTFTLTPPTQNRNIINTVGAPNNVPDRITTPLLNIRILISRQAFAGSLAQIRLSTVQFLLRRR